MTTIDQLLAVADCFTLEKIEEIRSDFGGALRAFYTDDEEESDDDFLTVGDEIRRVRRRQGELEALCHAHEEDIAWFFDQVTKIAFEAKVGT